MYFISSNKNKFREFEAEFPGLTLLPMDIPEVQSMDIHEVVQAKLEGAMRMAGVMSPLIVEDTALNLHCMGGFPGPLIKWMFESLGSMGIWELVRRYEEYGCRATTVIGYGNPATGEMVMFDGETDGKIVEPRVGSQFGWENIFMPAGHIQSFAQMDPTTKRKYSMRYAAIQRMKEHLKLTQKSQG